VCVYIYIYIYIYIISGICWCSEEHWGFNQQMYEYTYLHKYGYIICVCVPTGLLLCSWYYCLSFESNIFVASWCCFWIHLAYKHMDAYIHMVFMHTCVHVCVCIYTHIYSTTQNVCVLVKNYSVLDAKCVKVLKVETGIGVCVWVRRWTLRFKGERHMCWCMLYIYIYIYIYICWCMGER
jgi:hypothetical protein